MYEILGDREIALVKEITKMHENVIRTDLATASAMFDEEKPKGEFVVIVDGKRRRKRKYRLKVRLRRQSVLWQTE